MQGTRRALPPPPPGETRSGGTGGSHNEQRSQSANNRVRPIFHSHWDLKEPGGGSPGGVQIRWDGEYPPWKGYFSPPVSKGGKVQPKVTRFSLLQGCQLSRVIRESPDFEPYLPVSRFMSVISWIIAEVCYLW